MRVGYKWSIIFAAFAYANTLEFMPVPAPVPIALGFVALGIALITYLTPPKR